MISLQFDEITISHISGKWKIVSFLSSPRNETFFLEGLKEITFLADGNYIAITDKSMVGKWQLDSHKEVIANPIILFEFLNSKETDRAMITRYAYMPAEYGMEKNDEMILYFSNGSEYVLEKISN